MRKKTEQVREAARSEPPGHAWAAPARVQAEACVQAEGRGRSCQNGHRPGPGGEEKLGESSPQKSEAAVSTASPTWLRDEELCLGGRSAIAGRTLSLEGQWRSKTWHHVPPGPRSPFPPDASPTPTARGAAELADSGGLTCGVACPQRTAAPQLQARSQVLPVTASLPRATRVTSASHLPLGVAPAISK